MPQTDYVNWIEAIWTAEGIAGIILSMLSFSTAVADKAAIMYSGMNHGLEVIARTHIQTEVFRLVPHVFVTTIGIIALTTTPSPLPNDTISWVVTAMLFAIPICAALNSINTILTRRRLIKLNI